MQDGTGTLLNRAGTQAGVDLADALEGFDAAVLLLDAAGRLLAANGQFLRMVATKGSIPATGTPIGQVVSWMCDAGCVVVDAPDRTAALLSECLQGARQSLQLIVADGRVVDMCCKPTPRGGRLATFCSAMSNPVGEAQAHDLLGGAFHSTEMGMILWDRELTVQMANPAWGRLLAPVEIGMSGREYAAGLIANGLFDLPSGLDAEGLTELLIEQAREGSMRMEGRNRRGQHLMMCCFSLPSGGILGTAVDLSGLREAEDRVNDALGEIVSSLGEGVALYDSDLRLRMSNDALHRLAHPGHPRMEIGTHIREHAAYCATVGAVKLPDGMEIAQFEDMIEAAARAQARDVPVEMTDGRTLHLSVFPTTLDGTLLTLRDVTQKLRTEAAQAEADARVRKIVDALGEGVALYDADGMLLFNNPAFRRLVHGDPDAPREGVELASEIAQVIGKGTIDIGEADPDAVLAGILASIRNAEVNVPLPMGDGRTLEASNFVVEGGGRLVAMRDITSRLRAEEATREADALIRTMVAASPTEFVVTRLRDGEILYAPWFHGTPLWTDPAIETRYLAALQAQGALDDWPVTFEAADGTRREGRISARITEFRGEPIAVRTFRDITEDVAMREELDAQKAAAHQHEKLSALGELLAGVSHELNNPLSVVLGHAMMLADEVDDPALSERIAKISAAAGRSARIVKMFLAMARQRPATIAPCDLNEIVTATLEMSGNAFASIGAELVLDLAPDLPPVPADADQIAQVVSNLATNAEHALRGRVGARLIVSTRVAGDSVEIAMADNGPGVPSGLQTRIFEPFFTTKDVGLGTGVGLAFCHRIVTGHGGRLDLRRNGPDGATFVLSLPVERSEARTSEAAVAAGAAASRVLIVDDERDVGEMIADVLTRAGHDVTLHHDAKAALEACARTPFDAILSDVRMPDMDGPAFLAALRQRAPDQVARLAFVTGDAMGQGIDAFLAHCGRPHAEKPLSPAELRGIVADLLKGSTS
ncbi:PAS-domain containing protein [Roseobacter sp. HKCCA0434]|uniref:PAS-domain containing protein n=1 Tax=Roseobacter sp. HKCCA0434 TaxID=3079297 RepID=UPI0029058F60|nr:PAS-domain containing protein [Roseobacter sp. HKCCA0434]